MASKSLKMKVSLWTSLEEANILNQLCIIMEASKDLMMLMV